MTRRTLVPLNEVKKTAKQIKKLNPHINHTFSLTFLAQFLKFENFNDFESCFKKHHQNRYDFDSISDFSIYELENLKEALRGCADEVEVMLPTITFIDVYLKHQIVHINEMEALRPSAWLFLLPYRVKRFQEPVFDPATWQIDHESLYKGLAKWFDLYYGDNTSREWHYFYKNKSGDNTFFEGKLLEIAFDCQKTNNNQKMHDFIAQELEKEKDFLKKMSINGIYDFSMPVIANTSEEGSFLKEFGYLKNTTSLNRPFLLGHSIPTSRFKKPSPIALTKEQLLGNICVSGVAGTGKTMSMENYLHQALMNNSGFIYCEFSGDPSSIHRIKEKAKRHNRSEDVIVFTFNHLNSSRPVNFKKLIQKNKIVVVFIWALEKNIEQSTPFLVENILKPIKEGVIAQNNKVKNQYFPYIICLEEGMNLLIRDQQNTLDQSFFDAAYKNNVAIMISSQTIMNSHKNIMNHFSHCLLFRQESTEGMKTVNKQLKWLIVGEFLYMNNIEKRINGTIYRAPFLQMGHISPIYLSNYNINST